MSQTDSANSDGPSVTLFADTRKVTDGSGCHLLNIPSDVADALDIDLGDQMLITLEQGADGFEVYPAEQFSPYE